MRVESTVLMFFCIKPAGSYRYLQIVHSVREGKKVRQQVIATLVPLETVSARDGATAVGLIMGFGQIAGGFFGPAFGGILADRFGLAVPLWAAVAAGLVAAITCLFLDETAPAKTGRLSRTLAPDVPLPLQPGTEGAAAD